MILSDVLSGSWKRIKIPFQDNPTVTSVLLHRVSLMKTSYAIRLNRHEEKEREIERKRNRMRDQKKLLNPVYVSRETRMEN